MVPSRGRWIGGFWIGVGKAHWFEPPLPPNRAGGSPAHGSPVGGLTSKRIDRPVRRLFSSCTTHALQRISSFDPLFEGCQHPHCPNRRFDPAPTEQDLSGTFSPSGHCLRLFFHRFGHCVSTFLHPLARPELPGFLATMGAVTPERPALRFPCGRMNSGFGVVQGSLLIFIGSSDHSVPNHLPSPRRISGVFVRRAYRTTLPWLPRFRGPCVNWASPFPSGLATTVGRIEFIVVTCYGLIVHLRLLSTPPRGDAVTFSYRVPEHPGRDFHPADPMPSQAH
jgi:hypothetical protein